MRKLKYCFIDEKGRPVKLMPLKKVKRNPEEIVKVAILPNGNFWLCGEDKEFYYYAVGAGSSCVKRQKAPTKMMTWREYQKKERLIEARRVKELKKFLLQTEQLEKHMKEQAKKNPLVFGLSLAHSFS